MAIKNIIKLSASAAILTTLISSPLASIVNAETTSSEETISRSNIVPVANHDNNTLRQIAVNNNLDLAIVEKLNNNVDPDKPLPNGTAIYLPQNSNTENIIGPQVLGPYDGVPASIKAKYYDNLSSANRSAKLWIAKKESGYSYTAVNGRYYGRFQLDISYLNGDRSKTNQEKTADRYVKNRYGSWSAAKSFWINHGWY
ncbi:aggregation promoting protein [Lactobacillus bombicola]|uniref:aggregation-promoting factor C-terminal-like domain-containing protein n=1 Tax=Lactobacillus bombicola TaxID=1505723 RepID=UPI000E573606|nr:aggregation promoting protein [Lactobacillus bombicola]RHW50994.1 aggregation promoting protein [Lactobacillus bombicola]